MRIPGNGARTNVIFSRACFGFSKSFGFVWMTDWLSGSMTVWLLALPLSPPWLPSVAVCWSICFGLFDCCVDFPHYNFCRIKLLLSGILECHVSCISMDWCQPNVAATYTINGGGYSFFIFAMGVQKASIYYQFSHLCAGVCMSVRVWVVVLWSGVIVILVIGVVEWRMPECQMPIKVLC